MRRRSNLISFVLGQTASLFFLTFVLFCAFLDEFIHPPLRKATKKKSIILPHELKPLQSIAYYARLYGVACQTLTVPLKDDHFTTVYALSDPRRTNPQLIPIVFHHGLFQSAGIYLSNERDSLALALLESQHPVYLVDTRSCHVKSETISWHWDFDTLAFQDLPRIIEFILEHAKAQKLIHIGHSQGSAILFRALQKSAPSSVSNYLASTCHLLIAMAPAVHIQSTLPSWPLRVLRSSSPKDALIHHLLGHEECLPLMRQVQQVLHHRLFVMCAYRMFCFLFEWHDGNWDQRRKLKYFGWTPRPVTARLVWDWMAASKQGCIGIANSLTMSNDENEQDNTGSSSSDIYEMAFQPSFPIGLVYGTNDTLVNTEKLIASLRVQRVDCKILSVQGYAHLDLVWSDRLREHVTSTLLNWIQE